MLQKSNKAIFLLLTFFCSINLLHGQRYILIPGNSMQLPGFMEDLHTLTLLQKNISSDTITIKWKKLSAAVPAAWDASNCDNAICYTTLADSGFMNPLPPNANGFMLLHITPHVNYGICIVQYTVCDKDFPAAIDTLTYILNVSPNSGISGHLTNDKIQILPNPANKQVKIICENNTYSYITISNAMGKTFYSGSYHGNSETVTISDWPEGIYFIHMMDYKANFFQSKINIIH